MVWGPWNTTATEEHGSHAGVDLFEASPEAFTGIFFICLALVLSSAGGIGGGGILVPLFILMLHWDPKYAIPLSNVTIFAGGIMNTAVNCGKRHPVANRPLVVSAFSPKIPRSCDPL